MPVFVAKDTRGACVALFDYVSQRRALWRALLTGGAAPILRAQFIEQARRLATGFPSRSGDFCPVDLRVTHATSATIEILAWWLGHEPELAIDRIAEILDRLVITPSVTED
ncbi:hypothetical protein [Paraliomyxa miuraensis]|uniref:hypothetical protein n=1 Tax=Paraliomyxa miuraensis TaxID=376150 RepID=UPI00225A0EF0|nr:hypothetical protein [Paraliomyxa miuraensis]MCX4244085.1 hypothetical protein [Paraliomyxa miuraensis]